MSFRNFKTGYVKMAISKDRKPNKLHLLISTFGQHTPRDYNKYMINMNYLTATGTTGKFALNAQDLI